MRLRDTALAALALAFAPAGSASSATNERSTTFGTFSLIEEVRKVDPGEAPIIRVGTEGTKLHLRWRSTDSRLGVELSDDGSLMLIDVDGYECSERTIYLAYRNRAGEPDLRSEIGDALANLLKVCPRVPGRLRAAYGAEFERSEADYRVAVEAMKVRALRLFGGKLERCLPNMIGFRLVGPFCARTGLGHPLRRSAAHRRAR